MRIVLLGDVGVLSDMIHIGDEAMFEEFVRQLRGRDAGVEIVSLSSNPAETRQRYGVEAIRNVDFAPSSFAVTGEALRTAQEDRMRRVLAAADGDDEALPADDWAWAVIEAVRTADGVAVSGGGNMASIWPMHIFERATLAALAAHFDKPFVVSGQTIGPELTGDDRDLVARLLDSAKLVGLRETASLALVHELGVTGDRVTGTIDDASFLGAEGAGSSASPASSDADDAGVEPVRPYCAVTLAAHVGGLDRDAFAEGMAKLLDRVAEEAGLEIVFFAHFAALGGGVADPAGSASSGSVFSGSASSGPASSDSASSGSAPEAGDSLVHRRVIDRMTQPSRIEPTTDSIAAARFARGASLAVSSRYHPAIFAVSAGVPTVGIAVDDYTTVKLTGALGNFGQTGVLTASDVIDGSAVAGVLDVWSSADGIRSAWESRVAEIRAASDAWWDRVARALGL
ncbi:polysaccharide pyruvyl transferase family protein [Frondihabitans sp. 4ASC-45]|uniref:polysaccharide pyruvyl transferase family protein n=1 Tax=Frondihabitans sp. 4ASC-45 TaxID=3111636 RepID=UPI003C142212